MEFLKTDAPSLNLLLKTINDARHKMAPPDEVKFLIKKKFYNHENPWTHQFENILEDAEAKLFSYGSLQPGQQNEHMLKNISGHWRDGFVYGDVSPTGWGTSFGFPVLIPDYTGQKPQVPGKLFTAPGLINHWHILDEFEGEDYIRLLTLVYNGSTESITIANVYAASSYSEGR